MCGKSKLSQLVSGSVVIFSGKFFLLGIQFLGTILIARYLGAVELGSISLGILLMSTLTTIALFGTDTGISRYLSRNDDIKYKKGVIQMSLKVSVPLSILFAILVFINSSMVSRIVFNAPKLTSVVEIFALAIPVSVIQKSFLSSVRGLEKPVQKVIVSDIISPIIKISLIIAVIYYGLGETGLSWAYFLSLLVGALLLGYLVISEIGVKPITGFGPDIKSYLEYSSPLMITSIMTMSFSNIDRVFISQFGTTELVGIYSGIYNLTTLMMVVMTSVNFLFLPIFSSLHSNNEHDEMNIVYKTTTKWIIALSLPILVLFISFPSILIEITYGSDFLPGRTALIILTIGVATHIFSGLNRSALKAIGKTKEVTYGTAGVFLLNIILNFILVPDYSMVGAAIATTGSYLLWNVYYLLVLTRDINLDVLSQYNSLFFITNGALLYSISYAVKFFVVDELRALLVFIPFATLMYFGSVMMCILSRRDIELLQEINESSTVDLTIPIEYLDKYI